MTQVRDIFRWNPLLTKNLRALQAQPLVIFKLRRLRKMARLHQIVWIIALSALAALFSADAAPASSERTSSLWKAASTCK